MKYLPKKKAVLVLEDGSVYNGVSAGKQGTTFGEICFNTGMTGYQEIFTDPSYFGQIAVMTNAHIGNYGVTEQEVESDTVKIAGMVCKNFSTMYSRPSSTGSLQDYLDNEGVVSIGNVDTRALVRHIRSKGAMNAVISSDDVSVEDLKEKLSMIPSMAGLELASKVSTKEAFFYGDENAPVKVSVLDLGIKKNILKCIGDRGVYLKVFPHDTPAKDLLDWNPNGIFLSNGPGDPSVMKGVQKEVKILLEAGLPVFGICLGHQMIAIANDLGTAKMHNGHRGINHPVKNLITGKGEITSQNHGFVVNIEDAEKNPNIEVTHVHLNDKTLAGLKVKNKDIFSVQYHPESSPGPHDSRYLFDEFVELLNSKR
jgi:carbamoyl-phosphate synthase small subunit